MESDQTPALLNGKERRFASDKILQKQSTIADNQSKHHQLSHNKQEFQKSVGASTKAAVLEQPKSRRNVTKLDSTQSTRVDEASDGRRAEKNDQSERSKRGSEQTSTVTKKDQQRS